MIKLQEHYQIKCQEIQFITTIVVQLHAHLINILDYNGNNLQVLNVSVEIHSHKPSNMEEELVMKLGQELGVTISMPIQQQIQAVESKQWELIKILEIELYQYN